MARAAGLSILLAGLVGTSGLAESSHPRLDPQAVAAFADEHFESALAGTGNPGAVVAIVQQQQTLVLKGYGTADIGTGRAVDPERTLYRLGSLTKPMTAIAILRLVEQGVLDLDQSVDEYLRGVAMPTNYPEPITLRHLLTHQGGLDADLSFSAVGLPGTRQELSDAAIQRRLFRARAPGVVAAYDVLGYGVLARILTDVTGLSFDQVILENVFQPSGMDRAVIGLPADRQNDFARCHISTRPGDARICSQAALSAIYQGSGSAAATASDMASFMKVLLRQSAGTDAVLLAPETFAQFVDFDQYRFHPASRGLGLGIQELEFASRPAFGHGGAIQGFRTEMHLFPQYGIGIYYGVNGGAEQVYDARLSMLPRLVPAAVSDEVRQANARLRDFTSLFAEEFLPAALPAADPPVTRPKISPAEVAGFYLHNRFVSDNILMNLSRLGLPAEIESRGDGVWVDGNGPYEQVQPGLFESSEGRTVAFRVGDSGVWASFGGNPFVTYERVPWVARPVFSVLPLLPAVVLLLSAGVYLLPRFAGERRRGAVSWVAGSGLFALGFVLELEYGVLLGEIEGAVLLPLLWRIGLCVAALALVAAPVVARVWAWASDSRPAIRWIQRTHGSLIGVAGFYVVVFSLYWGLVI